MPITPHTVVNVMADKSFTKEHSPCYVTVEKGNDIDGTTAHLPFKHPQLPAPQSIGPWQLMVHARLQTPLFATLVQLVG
jgi:hypothetical protein